MAKVFAKPSLGATIDHQGRLHSWIGRKVGINKTLLSHVAAGRKAVKLETAKGIADLLDVPVFLPLDIPDGMIIDPDGMLAASEAIASAYPSASPSREADGYTDARHERDRGDVAHPSGEPGGRDRCAHDVRG